MLPKENRLTKKKDFELVFKQGKVFKSECLLFKTAENNLSESRFGFVVSKKISSKATIRNKVKRRLREAVAHHMVGGTKSLDVVIIALTGIQKKEFIDIEKIVSGFVKKFL